jgi:Rrf2 family nitric oxide-sensitive transcriptional repressor
MHLKYFKVGERAMNITRYTDYSLRVLIYLAVKDPEQCTISEIAQSYDISKNHLMKVVQSLAQTGYVKAVRGKNGGVSLNETAQRINVGKLVRSLEDKTRLVECFGKNNHCVITPACELKNMFAQAQEAFFVVLDGYSLSDLTNEPQGSSLKRLLLTVENDLGSTT